MLGGKLSESRVLQEVCSLWHGRTSSVPSKIHGRDKAMDDDIDTKDERQRIGV